MTDEVRPFSDADARGTLPLPTVPGVTAPAPAAGTASGHAGHTTAPTPTGSVPLGAAGTAARRAAAGQTPPAEASWTTRVADWLGWD